MAWLQLSTGSHIWDCLRNKHWKSDIPRSPALPRVYPTLFVETLKTRELHTNTLCGMLGKALDNHMIQQIPNPAPKPRDSKGFSPLSQRLGSDPKLASPNTAGKSGRDGMCRREVVQRSSACRHSFPSSWQFISHTNQNKTKVEFCPSPEHVAGHKWLHVEGQQPGRGTEQL